MLFYLQDFQDDTGGQNSPVSPIINYTPEEGYSLFNIPLWDSMDFKELILRFVLNLLFSFILIRFVYFTFNNRNREFAFTFFLFNIAIFFVSALMRNLNLSMGFAFGLFALFGLLRYRTEPVPIKDMTYLFIIICMGMINAMFSRRISYSELFTANVLTIGTAYAIERILAHRKESVKLINYEKIDLIRPENRTQLLEDLKNRTGLDIHRIHIERINFLRDTARIWVYYYENEKKSE
ncbi:MAG: DUF4956 domain-containing protein [Bacteroidetes bacterium]|nr:DUF4956 domain-containing protein [Bacteroidota bacterium]